MWKVETIAGNIWKRRNDMNLTWMRNDTGNYTCVTNDTFGVLETTISVDVQRELFRFLVCVFWLFLSEHQSMYR